MLDEATRQALTNLFHFEQHRAESVLQRAHQPITKLWLMQSGIVCCKATTSTKYNIDCFHFKGELIGHFNSYLQNTTYPMSLEVIRDVSCWSIDIATLLAFRDENPAIAPFFESFMSAKNHWIDDFRYNRRIRQAEPFYQWLLDNYPLYIELIPLKEIAACMDITQSHLSHLRNQSKENLL